MMPVSTKIQSKVSHPLQHTRSRMRLVRGFTKGQRRQENLTDTTFHTLSNEAGKISGERPAFCAPVQLEVADGWWVKVA